MAMFRLLTLFQETKREKQKFPTFYFCHTYLETKLLHPWEFFLGTNKSQTCNWILTIQYGVTPQVTSALPRKCGTIEMRRKRRFTYLHKQNAISKRCFSGIPLQKSRIDFMHFCLSQFIEPHILLTWSRQRLHEPSLSQASNAK